MADLSLPARDSVAAQAVLFERAKAEESLSLQILAKRSRIPFNTLRGWANGTQMPAWALGALGEAGVPDHLLSLVTAPFCRHIGSDEQDEATIDDAGESAHELAGAVRRARHPASPGGVAIVHTELAEIIPIARRTAGQSRSVARRSAA